MVQSPHAKAAPTNRRRPTVPTRRPRLTAEALRGLNLFNLNFNSQNLLNGDYVAVQAAREWLERMEKWKNCREDNLTDFQKTILRLRRTGLRNSAIVQKTGRK